MVAGLVNASNDVFCGIEGMPTEAELAKAVLALPPMVNGMTMGAADVSPSTEPGKVVKCSIEHGQGKKMLSFKETFPVMDSNGDPFAGGLYIKESKKFAGLGYSRFVLYDADNKPVCSAKHDSGKPLQRVYYINHSKPLKEDDKPVDKEGDVDLYPWFKVHDIDDSHLHFRSLLVWNGANYQPMMHIKPVMRKANDPHVGELLPPRKCDNMVVDTSDENKVYALLSKTKLDHRSAWQLCAAPGTDVLAMIMLGCLMDDMVGWFA